MDRKTYIWQQDRWDVDVPRFTWDASKIERLLGSARLCQGRLTGALSALGFDVRTATQLDAMTHELVTSSAIEGVRLERDSVRSSVARHLGLDACESAAADHYVDGLVEVMVDASHNYLAPLGRERLFGWHAALFPLGYSGPYKIDVGRWRGGEEAMQVVSGAMGRERVHYQAPPSDSVPAMMDVFLRWVDTEESIDLVLKAAVAHLWFVSIHPFDDGNGRLCRIITDMLLARADGLPQRFYSMSAAILAHRKEYYDVLEGTQKGTLDITRWLEWFLQVLVESLENSGKIVERIKAKTTFWDKYRGAIDNPRQKKILNMLWGDFFGVLTASKYAKIAKYSQDTALRDINYLISVGALVKNVGGGRSTSYSLAEE